MRPLSPVAGLPGWTNGKVARLNAGGAAGQQQMRRRSSGAVETRAPTSVHPGSESWARYDRRRARWATKRKRESDNGHQYEEAAVVLLKMVSTRDRDRERYGATYGRTVSWAFVEREVAGRGPVGVWVQCSVAHLPCTA